MINEKENPPLAGSEIAIIGMSGRFPGAKNIAEFWENVKNGVESIASFSDMELLAEGVDARLLNDSHYVKAWGILDGIEYFDAPFFGFTPVDARLIDPQTRLFLECCWEALEDAAYDPGAYNGFIGLYAGASDNVIWKVETRLAMADHPDIFWGSLLNSKDFVSLLVSYKLNLKGPSLTLYTACSSSLTAVHVACQAILNGECDMALAGGATVLFPHRTGYLYRPGMLHSPDGHCRAFDARARGTIFGSGVGVVLLKRLEDAIADNDHIYAIIKGSAINNDGLRKVGFTAPSIDGQAEVIRTARQMAHVEPESIGYIETHGTGTELGDPVEIAALETAFDTDKKGFCAIGSVKANVGHLDSAAGVVGLIKTALVLKHRLIPASLHFETPNPKIDFENSPFYVNTTLKEWKLEGTGADIEPLRAAVSSFGIGGTNAHIVLEEWLDPESTKVFSGVQGAVFSKKAPWLFLLSARTPQALQRTAQELADYLKNNPGVRLADVAYTLAIGRKHFNYRRIVLCSTYEEALDKLAAAQPDAAPAAVATGKTDLTKIPPGADLSALEKIGQLWLQGRCFDWTEFYTSHAVRRLSLPTYPFEREYHWIERRLLKMMSQVEIAPGQGLQDNIAGQAAPFKSPETKLAEAGRAVPPDLKPRPHLMTPYAPPTTELEQNICETWKRLFGFERIGIDDDFYELGGDSVKAITLTSDAGSFGLEMTLTDILSNPTIKRLAASLQERTVAKDLEEEIYERRLLAQLDCLEKLNKGRNERNIFIVHPENGMVGQFKEIALALEKKFNVYGIRARGLLQGEKLPGTPRQMIDDYIEQILAFQEREPYILAGFGAGNAIAYEIARELEKRSRRVEKIILLDALMFITDRSYRIIRMLRLLPAFATDRFVSSSEKKFKKRMQREDLVIKDSDDQALRQEKVQKYMTTLAGYVTSYGIVNAPLLALQAEAAPHTPAGQARFDRLTRSRAVSLQAPGSHDGMLEKPHVEKLAQAIMNEL